MIGRSSFEKIIYGSNFVQKWTLLKKPAAIYFVFGKNVVRQITEEFDKIIFAGFFSRCFFQCFYALISHVSMTGCRVTGISKSTKNKFVNGKAQNKP